jgi:hypothetical protein
MQIVKRIIMRFSPVSWYFLLFRSKYSPSSLRATDQVSYPYKLTRKIVVLYTLIVTLLRETGNQKILN